MIKLNYLHLYKGLLIIPISMILIVAGYQADAQDTVDATTLTGKYMFGYQGWQRAQGDGCNSGWFHWIRSGSVPDGTNMTVDIFPDLSECTSSELYPTNMHYSNGSVVGLYSTCNATTITRHFKWMKDYQVDGAWVQRFGPKNIGWTQSTNQTLLSCMKAAETYGRVFAVMYDISGADSSTIFSNITTDWMYLVDTFKVTQNPRYLNHKGKPVVSVWGWGFPDRQMSAACATQLVQWFHTGAAAKYQATVMAGVISDGGTSWLNLPDPWASAIRTADVISPWFVGSFGSASGASGADSWTSSRVVPDLAECKSLGKDYLPVVWPGFSWSNMHAGSTPLNQIPRLGGSFFWEQVYDYVNAGATMLYNAMFDEIDEGTAMLKICPRRSLGPVEGSWVTGDADGYDSLPSDWYLQLAGYAKKALTHQIPLSKTMPINPAKPSATPVIEAEQNRNQNVLHYRIDNKGGLLHVYNVDGERTEVSLFQTNGEKRMSFSYENKRGELSVPLFSPGAVSNGVYILSIKNGNRMLSASALILSR
jgi:hypothetical protein